MEQSLLVRKNQSLKEALSKINENAKGVVFVIDEGNKIVGVLTDGDIRRTLLSGYGLNDMISDHLKGDFVYADSTDPLEEISKKFTERISIIPILDKEGRVVDYAENKMNMRMALAEPYLSGNEYKYLNDAFLSTWVSSTGKYITKFEEAFSEYCGCKYGVATSNGTTALHLALLALGIGKGDEVIVPNLTFAATVNAVIYTGATPVIVDIEEDSWCISPTEIKKAITANTKAIIPVHIYGQPCDMGEICDIAQKNNLYIVEDCAEAHGAEWENRKIGSFGVISCFSFFGNKVITTGEGGMCLTNSKELNEKMRILRDHGMSKERKYYHEVIGFNYRMTNLQAAIGTAQIERIDEILKWRADLEDQYRKVFTDITGVKLQSNTLKNRKKIAWLVSVLVPEKKRDEILLNLKKNDIDARAFFIPLSEMEIYRKYARECPRSQAISKMGINLPTTYEVNQERIERIGSLFLSSLQ